MALKIFLTGATGYIGGSVHASLSKVHPEYEFTLLVRNEKRAEPIKAKYPSAKFVYGSLEDVSVIEKAAAEADVVIHTADSSDNVSGATAIAKGLAAGHSAAKPGYWIHLSGTSILTWYDSQNGRHGEAPIPEQKYADIDDIQRLVTLPDEAHHRNVDKIVQEAISDSVRVAIVCPPTIYGTGSGAVSTRSVQVPDLVVATLDLGYAPIVGAGLTEWDHIHIDDLTDLFVRFVEATQDPSLNSNPEVFGLNGYFFAEHGSHKWADVAHWIADEAAKQGFLAKPETKSVSMAEALKLEGPTTASWGRNSKSVAQRANKYLGWKATGKWSLRDEIAPLVASEAKARGVSKVA